MGSYTFSQVPRAEMPRSTFNRSHGHKTTFDADYLIPVLVDEALPGDTFQVHASMFARLATPIFPMMDNIYLDVFFFAVPNRLLWDNWQKFMGEQVNPGDSTDYQVPVLDSSGNVCESGDVLDYMGVPPGISDLTVSALYTRAYNLIWNEWFRDQNIQDRVVVDKDDGPDDPGDYGALLKRGKRHDYFTSCLPWPQKGPGVNLPLGTTAPLIADPTTPLPTMHTVSDATVRSLQAQTGGMGLTGLVSAASDTRWDNAGLVADLSNATAATINSLRQAFQIQKLLERDARGGTRYVEILKSHFGVTSPDARLQRPEFLGGGSIPVIINPVAQTSQTDVAVSPQGNLAAYGVAGASNIGFTKSFVEHSIIVGLICARADLTYQQGLPRMFSRRTRYDFYWPAFAHLGEQAVLNKEIYAQGTGDDDLVFGYQERWAEYRYYPSKVTGQMRSSYAQPLDAWHLAQDFAALPVLTDPAFIESSTPLDRVVAVPAEPHFLFDSHFKMKCTRPMPTYSVPGLIDHF